VQLDEAVVLVEHLRSPPRGRNLKELLFRYCGVFRGRNEMQALRDAQMMGIDDQCSAADGAEIHY
jgi:hypothetical protein